LVLSVQVFGPGELHAVIVAGTSFAKMRSYNGAPPVKAMPLATTVVVWPTVQQGPAGGTPHSAPSTQVPSFGGGLVQCAFVKHGRDGFRLQCFTWSGPLPSNEQLSPFASV
jgi:hypothetical protein